MTTTTCGACGTGLDPYRNCPNVIGHEPTERKDSPETMTTTPTFIDYNPSQTTANGGLSDADLNDWIEGLLSEAYEQGTNRLCDADGRYCCLGVLAERDGINMGSLAPMSQFRVMGELSGVGARGHGPAILDRIPLDVRYVLTEANDSGIPFARIARFLDENRDLVQAGPDAQFPNLTVQDSFPDYYDEDGYRRLDSEVAA